MWEITLQTGAVGLFYNATVQGKPETTGRQVLILNSSLNLMSVLEDFL